MLRVRVEVELAHGNITQEFNFEDENLGHLPSQFSGRNIRTLLHETAERMAEDVEALWGKAP